jgi:hypothetical protein
MVRLKLIEGQEMGKTVHFTVGKRLSTDAGTCLQEVRKNECCWWLSLVTHTIRRATWNECKNVIGVNCRNGVDNILKHEQLYRHSLDSRRQAVGTSSGALSRHRGRLG